ncbi:patatin-like phospholipase family protein [Desulfobacter curvatus]|uniref:patatin-like phospholipase family protein n=1 Tax=Desulfobacter curvatus TaxID=2290 RepID=UPI0003748CC9|nr:patatin-like phospholipase family protein [Desulfobacter curvatus]
MPGSRKPIHTTVIYFAVMAVLVAITGCGGAALRNSDPPELSAKVEIPGIPRARFWGDEWPEALRTASESNLSQASSLYNTRHHYLAISRGGANGAFGAGLLCGWSAAGTRPEFTMVTGISTGALTAPFAFLGSKYDDTLKTIYTTISTKDIVKKKSAFAILFSDSMVDTTPLKAMIARYINAYIVDAIAGEYKKGRRLFIGTFNLDADRSVIWDIGAIAVSNYSGKLELIHEILRASAAIPVAFPPVMIQVEANGKKFDELHVDGGTSSQVFVYPATVDWKSIMERSKVQGTPEVYVIRNSFLESDVNGVKPQLIPIATRSVDSLIRTQGIGDFYQIYALCQRDGTNFNLAWIPSDFTEKPAESFDPVYMEKLFDRGFQMAREGYPWEKAPPGFIVNPE